MLYFKHTNYHKKDTERLFYRCIMQIKKYIDLIFFQIYEKIFSTNAFIYTYFMAILNVTF